MKQLLDQEECAPPLDIPVHHSSDPSHSWFQKGMVLGNWILIVLALVTGAGLLINDLAPHLFLDLPHAPLSAAPLLLIGAASLGFQVLARPTPLDTLKALLVSLAFILWGIGQVLPIGWLATTIGDVVIVLYVVDLGWMMGAILRQRRGRHR